MTGKNGFVQDSRLSEAAIKSDLSSDKKDAHARSGTGFDAKLPARACALRNSGCKSRLGRRLRWNSLLIPCTFPGRFEIVSVHAALAAKTLLAGIFFLQNSLGREFAAHRLRPKASGIR